VADGGGFVAEHAQVFPLFCNTFRYVRFLKNWTEEVSLTSTTHHKAAPRDKKVWK
jgi:hypothetical protein